MTSIYTRESMECTLGPIHDGQSVLVPINHPIIKLMKANEKLLGINMSMVEPIVIKGCKDIGPTYCVSAPIVNKCIDRLLDVAAKKKAGDNEGPAQQTVHREQAEP
jgi:hypothetical protein